MPGRRRVSIRQLELLVEFAESNREVALGRFPGGPQAVQVSRQLWESLTIQLNSVAVGASKTPDQWRRYWIEFKAKTKSKAADLRRNAAATGGGPNKLGPLNELDKRVLALLGPVAVEGLPGVRLPSNIPSVAEVAAPVHFDDAAPDPINPSASRPFPQSSAPRSVSPDPIMEVEWLEDENPSPLVALTQSQNFDVSPSPTTQPTLPLSSSRQPPVPSSFTETALPSSTETQPTPQQLQDISREDRHAQQFTPPTSRRIRRPRAQTHRDEPPRWAYEIESRRIAAEERLATAMEALVSLIRQIRDDVHNYVNR